MKLDRIELNMHRIFKGRSQGKKTTQYGPTGLPRPRRATAEATAEIAGKRRRSAEETADRTVRARRALRAPSHERGRAAASDQTSMAFQVSFNIGRWQNRMKMTLLRADVQ